jgi:LruC domain-containing protein
MKSTCPTGHQPIWLIAQIFGTFHDNTIPGQNRWYKTSDNLPWAIHVMDSFEYPIEKVEITSGYLFMGSWAESAGTVYIDWFKPMPGYRDASKIFSTGN